jgi:adenylate cyclase
VDGSRRLTTIMFTDIVGYSAMAQRDESGALALLERHNRLLRSIFPRFHGREIKTIGDAFLVEFPSALGATQCAVEIQRAVHDAAPASPPQETLRLRIGIHLGDVVRKRGDVLGDAVNIASRIEPLAEPGGICISAQVFDQVRDRLGNPLVKIEPRELKNIQIPIEIYKVLLPWERSPAGGAVSGASGGPRLAVLPFTNMSPDPQDEYFADGLTEEVITKLSRLAGLRVIARTSVMRYKSAPKTVADVGEALRVQFVLEGSVRKVGNKIRITTQLIDARSEEHLWAGTFDRELTDFFVIQSEIASEVSSALHLALPHATAGRREPTSNVEAFEACLMARSLWNRRTIDAVRSALNRFEEALRLDPQYAQANSGVADCYSILMDRGQLRWSEAHPRAKAAALRALALDHMLPEAHASLGLVLMHEFDWEGAERELRQSIELDPTYVSARHWYYMLLMTRGRIPEAARQLREAKDLDPLSPRIAEHLGILAWVEGRTDEAMGLWDLARDLGHETETDRVYKIALLAGEGRRTEALALAKLPFVDKSGYVGAAAPAIVHGVLGMKDEAHRDIERLLKLAKTSYVPAFQLSWAYGVLGEAEGFYEWSFRFVEEKGTIPYWVTILPMFREVRKDSRFTEFLRRCRLIG